MNDVGRINKARREGRWVITERWDEVDFCTGNIVSACNRFISEHTTEEEAFKVFDACISKWTPDTEFHLMDPIGKPECTGVDRVELILTAAAATA